MQSQQQESIRLQGEIRLIKQILDRSFERELKEFAINEAKEKDNAR